MSQNAKSQPDAKADNRVFVLILQHPQERREALATAAIAVAALARAKLAVGLSWPNLPRTLGREADPRRWGVLYLGSAHRSAFPAEQELVVVGGRGEPIEKPDPVLRGLEGIVLNPARPARLGRLRREPRREALSTIEAAALVLRRLEPTPAPAEALLAALDRLIAASRRPQQPVAEPEP